MTDAPALNDGSGHIFLGSRTLNLALLCDMIDLEHPTRLVGAHPACDWVLQDTGVPGVHAAVQVQAQGFALLDLCSSNGLRCDGEREERNATLPDSASAIGSQTLRGAELVVRVGLRWPGPSRPVAKSHASDDGCRALLLPLTASSSPP